MVENEDSKSIEPTKAAEREWADLIAAQTERTLFRLTDSWWNRGNVPGGKAQYLSYVAGINEYEIHCREAIESGEGFIIKSW